MQQLQKTKAAPLWSYFLNICATPHPSKHEQQLAEWIINWANEKHISCTQDKAGNLLLRKPASSGYEHKTPTILQAHLDMVPQKNSSKEHDFLTDAITPIISGEWLHADNTTLGADNGIGIASCLAVLEDNTIDHPPLEVLLTTDEETSMTGAFALQAKTLQGKILINTDSEQEGTLYVGCSGSIDLNIDFPYIKTEIEATESAYEISLSGLKGGHSGRDIHLQRGNAIKVLADVLHDLDAIPFRLACFEGGSLRNTIPREAHAVIVCDKCYQNSLEVMINNLQLGLRSKFHNLEKNLQLSVKSCNLPSFALLGQCQSDFLDCLQGCDNGVIAMSDDFPDAVQTSSNIGVVEQNKGEKSSFSIKILVRSQIDYEKLVIVEKIAQLFNDHGAPYRIDGNYPSWQQNPDSPIYKIITEQYSKLFNKKTESKVIHTGLECGLFKNKYPDLDIISFGPTITSPHTPDEKVHIASVDKYWQLLIATLKAIA
jgi:dipeptidase D